MNKFLRIFLVVAAFSFTQQLLAANYTVAVGSSKEIYCTATAPAGYITHVFFSLVDPNDAQYVALNSHSSDNYATIIGLQAKANIKVEVTYAYSYTGTYDHQIHVGHGTYYDYITVTGGVKPTEVEIAEGDIEMLVGETATLTAKLTPSNASATYTWGFVVGFGKPYNFDLTYIGGKATIKAQGEGSAYVICQTDNGKTAVCTVTARKSNEPPTNIQLNDEEAVVEVGASKSLSYTLTPVSAATTITWSSSNEAVATVSSKGKVKAVSPGNAIITAITDNGLSATIQVRVPQNIERITLPENIEIALGYSEKISVTKSPSNAEGLLKWTSSDQSVVSVDADGVVRGKQLGTADITVKAATGATATCTITVANSKNGYDYRDMQSRINVIQRLAQKVFESNRK